LIFLVFVVAVLVSGAFERQARRHRLELEMESERLGIPIPPPRPKLKRAEAWMNVGVGCLLAMIAILYIWTAIGIMNVDEQIPGRDTRLKEVPNQMILGGAFFLAGGIALTWLGWKAVSEISRFESGASGSLPDGGSEAGISRATGFTHRPVRLTLTAAIAAGAFVAGILTGYLFLSRTPSPPQNSGGARATVSIDIQSGDNSGIPPGFSEELSSRITQQLSSLPGVNVVHGANANYSFIARLTRDNGAIDITWSVIRTNDRAMYFNRTFSIPVEIPGNSIQTMISSLSTTFGEKRTTAEFERILQLPEHSLD
jgi:hypothetical protein